MGAVAEVVSDAFEAVGDAVGQVAEEIGHAAEEVGHVVEEVGQAVGQTVQAIADDPAKGLVLIAVAVLAPELAPLLWEGATIAEAAMVLNTGLQLAQGADPMAIAQNLATSYITQGITSGLDVSTGYNFADRAIGNAASAAIQGGDVNRAIGSSLGNTLIGMGTGAASSGIRNFDYNSLFDNAVNQSNMSEQDAVQLTQGKIFEDAINDGMDEQQAANLARSFDAEEAKLANSQVFKDAVAAGFSTDEAFAIAKGNQDAENPTVSNPVAGSKVTVEGYASDVPETTSPITYASVSKEDLDKELGDGEIDQETYDSLIKYASDTSKSEQEYVDPREAIDVEPTTEPTTEPSPIDATKPDATTTPYGALNATTNEDGSTLYTYDDGSTLTLDGSGEVLDVTDATDSGIGTGGTGTGEDGTNTTYDNAMDNAEDAEYVEDEYEEVEDPTSKTGFSIKIGTGGTKTRTPVPRLPKAKVVRNTLSPTKTTKPAAKPVAGSTTETGALDALGGGQYGSALTANTSKGNADYSLLGELDSEDPQGFASGGSATQGVYDLSTTASSPFLGGGNSDIMALKPGVVKGKINYALPGYPFGQEWKAAKQGGHMVSDHNPSFFSEGGLGKMKNTYVKGEGDGTSDSIAAMLANGEFVIPADVVSNLGNGSNDAGAKVLDEFLRTIRAHKRKADPKGLPPDSKGALGYLATAKKKVKK